MFTITVAVCDLFFLYYVYLQYIYICIKFVCLIILIVYKLTHTHRPWFLYFSFFCYVSTCALLELVL